MYQPLAIIAFVLFATLALAKDIAILLGETGVGKTSLVNFRIENAPGIEGHGLGSCTMQPQMYCVNENFCYMDTQGMFCTTGTDDKVIAADILQAARAEHAKGNRIVGIYLVHDGTFKKWQLRPQVHRLVMTFGTPVLESLVLVVNRDQAITQQARDEIISYIISSIGHLVAPETLKNRVVFIDTKGDQDKYLPALVGIPSLPLAPEALTITDTEIEKRANMVFESAGNIEIYTVTSQQTVYANVQRTVTLQEPFKHQCNCHEVCRKRIFGICIKRRTACDECSSTRDVSRFIMEQVPRVVTSTEQRQRKKYEHAVIRAQQEKALEEEMKQKIFIN